MHGQIGGASGRSSETRSSTSGRRPSSSSIDRGLGTRLVGDRKIELDPPGTEVSSVGDKESSVDIGRDHLLTVLRPPSPHGGA